MKTIIEIGANKGQDTEKFIKEPNTFLYCIEPVPYLIEELKKKYEDVKNIKLFQLAIDNFNGKSRFGLSASYWPNSKSSYACSSLNEFSDNIVNEWGNRPDFNMIEYIEVDVMTLKSFIEQENISQIDYLHCDSQGSDLNILKSLGNKIDLIKKGRCEGFNTKTLYKNVDNSIHSILEFLELNGFEIIQYIDGNNNIINNPIFGLTDEGKKYFPHNTEEIDVVFEKKKLKKIN